MIKPTSVPEVGTVEPTDTESVAGVTPLVGLTTKAIYGGDFLLEAGIDWKAHNKLVGERPAAQKVTADRLAFMEAQKKALPKI